MKKILIVTTHWPPSQNSGVSLSAQAHLRFLYDEGYQTISMGSSNFNSPFVEKHIFVDSSGSGSLYSKAKVDTKNLELIINSEAPSLVIVHGWQMALNDCVVNISYKLGFPVMVFSHGVYFHPLSISFFEWIRAFCWLPYRLNMLKRISKLKAICTLSKSTNSLRFYDILLAKKANTPIFYVPNFAINTLEFAKDYDARKNQILVIGYFSRIKNQMAALKLLIKLPLNINIFFIGKKKGKYYEKVVKYANDSGLSERIIFKNDNEVSISKEIASSKLVFMPSITEALPLTLLEAMSSGTPFVALKVGAIPDLKGGILLDNLNQSSQEINRLLNNKRLWNRLSGNGLRFYKAKFSEAIVKKKFINAVQFCLSK